MSLINDALKRSQKGDRKIDMTNMRPVDGGRGGGPGLTILVVCLVVAGAITLGIWSYWNKKYKDGYRATDEKTNAPAATVPAATNSNPLARAAQTLGAVKDRNDAGTQTAETMQQPQQPIAVVRQPAPGSIKAPPPAVDDPKVQAIFFRLNDPTALIDGKTVGPGSPIRGGKVLEISRESVKVEFNGQVRNLTIKKK